MKQRQNKFSLTSRLLALASFSMMLCILAVAASPVSRPPATPAVKQPHAINLSGRWYGGDGDCTVTQSGNIISITNGVTTWRGMLTGNIISGVWDCPTYNQKGTFQKFIYDPNYQRGYMERISGTYYIESKWGKDPRDFYADRKIGK